MNGTTQTNAPAEAGAPDRHRSAAAMSRRTALDLHALFSPSRDLADRVPRPYQAEAIDALTRALARPELSILALPTGSGKTFVANEVVRRAAATQRVLWLASSWELLVQAASSYAQRFDGTCDQARLGGSTSPLAPVMGECAQAPVQYSTLHTWYRRRTRPALEAKNVGLLVIDECHWGLKGAMGRALLRHYHGRIPILGLSATPRAIETPAATSPPRICYRKTFAELEGTYLASPRLQTPLTHTDWRPALSGTGDFAAGSLRELAEDDGRNELICRTLLQGIRSGQYSRVMVFACNVAHADRLADLFSQHGVDARALHSAINSERRKSEMIAAFKQGAFNVIVNVAMLTHGVDVPDVDAVFLARPTASEVLCSQMVGRGARRIDGSKHHFWIVEFTDNLARHGQQVFHARDLLPEARSEPRSRLRARPRAAHAPPPEHPRLLRLQGPRQIAGLTYVQDQTFGVEIEFTSPYGSPNHTGLVYTNPQWKRVARTLVRAIASAARLPVDPTPRNYHQVDDTDRWRVEFDRSAGWEVVSPILKNQEGFSELVRVLSALRLLLKQSRDLHINHRAGLHVTLGSDFREDRQVQGLVRLTQILEPGLFTLVAPSRLFEFQAGRYALEDSNPYCRPLRELDVDVSSLSLGAFERRDPSIRYRTVNLSNVGRDDQHIEVRLHNSTTEYPVVVAWTSLWMTLFNRARFHWPEEGNTDPIFARGNVAIDGPQAEEEDLFSLLEHVDVHVDPRLRETLRQRRERVLSSWMQAIPARVLSWRAHWARSFAAQAHP